MTSPHAFLAIGEASSFATILLGLACILGLALLGRSLVSRLGQPGVLGEICGGILLGNLGVWLGVPVIEVLASMDQVNLILDTMLHENVSLSVAGRQVLTLARPESAGTAERIVALLNGDGGTRLVLVGQATRLFSDLGVVLLMFMTGLKASVGTLKASGRSAVRVALVATLVPFALTAGTSLFMRPDASLLAHLFLGVLFMDTIMGITARIFGDAGRTETREAQTVLGAAVLCQLMVVVLIAVVTTLAVTSEPSLGQLAAVVGLALVYILLCTVYGERLVTRLVPVFDALDFRSGRFLFALTLVFVLSWLASVAGLAAVTGGFAAGLLLNEERLPPSADRVSIRERAAPLEALFSPVFFVIVGMQVDLMAFADPGALALAGLLLVVGLGGKLLSGLAAGAGLDRKVVGIAMMPRGGTTLIFAGLGRSADLISDEAFAALAIFVIVSMLVTGTLLQRSLRATATG